MCNNFINSRSISILIPSLRGQLQYLSTPLYLVWFIRTTILFLPEYLLSINDNIWKNAMLRNSKMPLRPTKPTFLCTFEHAYFVFVHEFQTVVWFWAKTLMTRLRPEVIDSCDLLTIDGSHLILIDFSMLVVLVLLTWCVKTVYIL